MIKKSFTLGLNVALNTSDNVMTFCIPKTRLSFTLKTEGEKEVAKAFNTLDFAQSDTFRPGAMNAGLDGTKKGLMFHNMECTVLLQSSTILLKDQRRVFVHSINIATEYKHTMNILYVNPIDMLIKFSEFFEEGEVLYTKMA